MSAARSGHATLRGVATNGLALLGVMLTGAGLAGLLRVVLESLADPLVAGTTDTGLALGLSLTVVGLPLWLLAWRASERAVRQRAAEDRALARRVHLGLTRVVALSLTAVYGFRVLLWILQVEPLDPTALARLLVWGAVWGYHEHVAVRRRLGAPRTRLVDRLEAYGAAAVGLWVAAGAVGVVLERTLDRLWDAAVGTTLLAAETGFGEDLLAAGAAVAVGGAAWWWHWLVRGRRDAGSTPWLTTLFLVGILGGALTAITGAATLVHRALTWALGAADASAALHFEAVPAALAALVVGGVVWGWHRAHLREHAPERRRTGAERTYWYLLTGTGVLTSAFGLTVLLGVGLDLLVPSRTLVGADDTVREAVAAGLTAVVVGLPVWGGAWRHVQRVVAAEPRERGALARRILIVGVLGTAVVATVVALGTVLFNLFEAMLAGTLSLAIVEEQRWGLATVLTAAALSVHYGLVLREDRAGDKAEEEVGPGPAPEEVLVVARDAGPLAEALGDLLGGVTVTHWPLVSSPPARDGDGEAADPAVLAPAIASMDATRVLVLVEDDGSVRLLPLGAPVTDGAEGP